MQTGGIPGNNEGGAKIPELGGRGSLGPLRNAEAAQGGVILTPSRNVPVPLYCPQRAD